MSWTVFEVGQAEDKDDLRDAKLYCTGNLVRPGERALIRGRHLGRWSHSVSSTKSINGP